MSRNFKVFLGLSFLIMMLISCMNVFAYPEIESYTYLENADENYNLESENYQNHVFYSKESGKWYIVYNYQSGDLRYTILNHDGSIYEENIDWGSAAVLSAVTDFHIETNEYGNIAWLFWLYTIDASNTGSYAMYLIVNTETKRLDSSVIDTVDTTGKKIDITGTITKEGYPIMAFTEQAATYQARVIYSNTKTTFTLTSDVNIGSLAVHKGYSWSSSGTPVCRPIRWRNTIAILAASYDNTNKWCKVAIVFRLNSMAVAFDGYAAGDYSDKALFTNNPYDYLYRLNWDIGYNYKDEHFIGWFKSHIGTARQIFTWIYNNGTDTYTERIVYTLGTNPDSEEYPINCVMDDKGNYALIEAHKPTTTFRKWTYDGTWHNDTLWDYGIVDSEGEFTDNRIDIGSYVFNFTTLQNTLMMNYILVDGVGVPDDDLWLAFFGLHEDVFPPIPLNYIKLDNIESNLASPYGVLIFPNEEHNIEANFNENVTFIFIDIEDAENYIRFNYNVTMNKAYTNIVNKKVNDAKNVAFISGYNLVDNGLNLTLSLDFKVNNEILDYYSQILEYGVYYEDEWLNYTSTIRYSIFNEGGIPVYSGEGDYTIYDDNDIFSIGATNNTSWVRFDVLYNKLQHMHFNVELDISGDWDSVNGIWVNCTGGLFEYGIDYFIEDELLEGWKIVIYPSSVVVGHQNLGLDFDYVQWNIDHYFYNRTLEDYQLVKTDFLYSNFNGYDNENSVPDYHNKTSATFWFDMWFSNDNSSRKVATRINSEWFGMYEQGASWWFGYGAFRPVMGDDIFSIFYNNVYDANMSITTVKGNVDLVRFWGRVEKITGGDKEYIMHNYLMKNKILAINEMIGIDTPPLVDTKVMDMPQTGFLAPLIKVLNDIGKMILSGIIGVLAYLTTLIDEMLISLGLPPLLSIFYDVLVSIYEIFELLYVNFVNIMDWIIESLNNVILSVFLVIPRYILFVGILVDVFIQYYDTIVLLFTGGIGNMSNFWNDYPVMEFIQLWLICIFPFIEIARIENSKDPLGTLKGDVQTFMDIVMGLFGFLYSLLQVILNILERLLGILPF